MHPLFGSYFFFISIAIAGANLWLGDTKTVHNFLNDNTIPLSQNPPKSFEIRKKRNSDRSRVSRLRALKSNSWLDLEETDHVLYGSATSAYLATGKRSDPHSLITDITYLRIPFPVPQYLKKLERNKRDSQTVKLIQDDQILVDKLNVSSIFQDFDELKKSNPKRAKRFNSATAIGYLNILIQVDYETYTETFNKNLESLGEYMVAFWNAVDLRFREFDAPKIRLSIAGLIIPQNPEASYALSHQYQHDSRDLLNLLNYQLKRDSGVIPLQTYNIAVGMLKLDFMESPDREGKIVGRVRGIHLCGRKHEKTVALIVDDGKFGGVLTAAHELGHALGANHDDDTRNTKSYDECGKKEEDFLMHSKHSADEPVPNMIRWSQCSKEQIRDRSIFVQEAHCIYKKPIIGIPYKKVLPGKLKTRQQQCQEYFGSNYTPLPMNKANCINLICKGYFMNFGNFKLFYSTKTSPRIIIEGTDCGDSRMCLDGQCVWA